MRKIGRTFTFLILILALAALVVFMIGAGRRKRAEEEIRAKTRRIIEELWNKGNPDIVDELYAPEYVRHNPAAFGGDIEGREANKQYAAGTHRDFPDFQCTEVEIIVEGDTRTLRYTIQGTHKSGAEMTFEGCSVAHFVDGKFVEEWEYYDGIDIMQQFGFKLVPPGKQGGK